MSLRGQASSAQMTSLGVKGLFTRSISERDFTVSWCLLLNIIIFIFRKMGQPNACVKIDLKLTALVCHPTKYVNKAE
jgi:hypothetical protein